ncbi:MAG TPA: AbrB/MazE/SpoVT family DNA-binding domain-containing protein [Bryobacteraceae bacterium]|nr:AbrB/MazE/SpoVT family DNA-binding domain-containing protein [Bryobacteraceae bacterium]
MAAVTVKDKYRVVIPRAIREKLGISRGDVLEAKAERGRLTYTPKAVIDRIPPGKAARERFFKKLRDEAPDWLKETWAASKRRGTDKLTMREINAEVSAVRRRRAKKNSPPAR